MIRFRDDFQRSFAIGGVECLDEAEALAARIASDVELAANYDHALLVGDRFLAMAGPLETLGYLVGADETLYLGEVEGLRYVGISATLGRDAPARARGWFEHVLISQPAHQPAHDRIQDSYRGGPVLHHVALAVSSQARANESDEAYALRVTPDFVRLWRRVAELTGAPRQKLTLSVPHAVLSGDGFRAAVASWAHDCDPASLAFEVMRGGGFMLQFASSETYRVEVVLRRGTTLGFNPAAQTRLSRDVTYRA